MANGGEAMKLEARYVEKPWGRTELPPAFGSTGGQPVGEIWFEGAADLPLLVKYIFTSDRLSIQVHPNDEQARALGLPHGKNECWYILDAEPGAVLGLGLNAPTDREALRAAALDGSIEQLMHWRPVKTGDVIYVPAGTIHAIGAGVSLLEIQQNIDVTYRLYDYGRPRELHLDQGLRVAKPLPYPDDFASQAGEPGDRVLVSVAPFTLVRCSGNGSDAESLVGRDRWAVPIAGSARSEDSEAGVGECLYLPAGAPFDASGDATILLAAAGPLP